MKRGKKVLFGILILGIIAVSVGFVFGDEEGELPSLPTDVDLTVAGAPNPPEIVYITDIGGILVIGDVPSAERDLTAGTTTARMFRFYAYSAGGTSALPSGALVADDANITMYNYMGPGKSPAYDNRNTRFSSSCTRGTDANAPAGSVSHVGELTAVYDCTVNLQYYDSWGTATAPNWTVNASVKDTFDQVDSDSNSNTDSQYSRFTYFNILRAFGLNPAAPTLDYGTVNYGTGLNKEPASNYPIGVDNTGNTDVDVVEVRAFNIPDALDDAVGDTDYIIPDWFSVDPTSACGGGNNLANNVYIDSGIVDIIHGPSASSNLRICLNQLLVSHAGGDVSQQSYSTSGPGGQQWEVEVPTWLQ